MRQARASRREAWAANDPHVQLYRAEVAMRGGYDGTRVPTGSRAIIEQVRALVEMDGYQSHTLPRYWTPTS